MTATRLRGSAALPASGPGGACSASADPRPRMTPGEAAWVRQHVWTEGMRRVETATWPGHYTRCECQRGACHQCKRGVHERCMGRPRQSREGMICDRTGVHPAIFATPYKHVTVDGSPHPTPVAQVWLADRVCRWVCPCGHPAQAEPVAAPEPARPVRYELVPLPGFEFAGVAP
jgi:hypothetical protein